MLQNHKNSMLCVLAILFWVSGGFIGFLMATDQFVDAFLGFVRMGEMLFVGSAIWLALHYNLRSNLASWILSIYTLLTYLYNIPHQLSTYGEVQNNYSVIVSIFLWFFLVGKRSALLLSLFWGLGLFALYAWYDWNPIVLGSHASIFLFTVAAAVLIAYVIEHSRESHANRANLVAGTDELTTLANRSGFMIRLDASVMRKKPFLLVQMDIDDFRKINLALGTEQADIILKAVGHILLSKSNIYDACRHYGDGFAWIFEGSEEALNLLFRELHNDFAILEKTHTKGLKLTATMGATRFPGDSQLPKELWAQAETALKEAKRTQKDGLAFYKGESSQQELAQIQLLQDLRKAIQQEELQVHFQPKICVSSQTVCGMEALVRWLRPNKSPIGPGVFIPLAEQHGLIHEIGFLVIRKSIAALQYLQQQGYPNITISVNISPSQFAMSGFLQDLLKLCQEGQIAPKQLWLEVTESMVLNPDTKPMLEEFRRAGFHFSLDDFGTGYSSLSYLANYNFEELKIDKSFTDGIMHSERARSLFAQIISLGRTLGMKIVVEGVETREQVDVIGIHEDVQIQGWHYSRDLPIEKCLAFIQSMPGNVSPSNNG